MNVELLQKIKEVILAEPAKLDMADWFYRPAEWDESILAPTCGTVGCIAGWALLLNESGGLTDDNHLIDATVNVEDHVFSYSEEAVKILKLRHTNLFYPSKWPAEFWGRLSNTTRGTPEYAAVVADVIDNYIANNGWV